MKRFLGKLDRDAPNLSSVPGTSRGTGNFPAWRQPKGLIVSGFDFGGSANHFKCDAPLYVRRTDEIGL